MSFFSRSAAAPFRTPLNLDCLEGRDVPSATLDLTTAGSHGEVNGAQFAQVASQPTGTGAINSFVRVQALGNRTVEEGYNTSARPLAYDENSSPQFTRALRVADTPVYTDPVTGARYREFLLDINQKASAPLLSLDALKVFVAANESLSGKLDAGGNLPGAELRYDLDAGGDAWIALNARLNSGSGAGDMMLRVPEAQLAGGEFLYLYSKFGAVGGAYAASGGFEEWAVVGQPGGAISDRAVLSGYLYFYGDGASPVPAGTHVYLLDAAGTIVDVVQTDADGRFQFNNVLLADTTASFTLHVGNGAYDSTGAAVFGEYTFQLSPSEEPGTNTYDLGEIYV